MKKLCEIWFHHCCKWRISEWINLPVIEFIVGLRVTSNLLTCKNPQIFIQTHRCLILASPIAPLEITTVDFRSSSPIYMTFEITQDCCLGFIYRISIVWDCRQLSIINFKHQHNFLAISTSFSALLVYLFEFLQLYLGFGLIVIDCSYT